MSNILRTVDIRPSRLISAAGLHPGRDGNDQRGWCRSRPTLRHNYRMMAMKPVPPKERDKAVATS